MLVAQLESVFEIQFKIQTLPERDQVISVFLFTKYFKAALGIQYCFITSLCY